MEVQTLLPSPTDSFDALVLPDLARLDPVNDIDIADPSANTESNLESTSDSCIDDSFSAYAALGSASELVLRSLLVDPTSPLLQQGSETVVQLALCGGQTYVGGLEEGRMQGEGHYSWPEGLQFEGRFERGCMAAEGRITWPDGVQYAGQLDAGRRHGFGKLDLGDAQHRMQYSGEWKHGLRHGKGRLQYRSGSSTANCCWYDGDWVADRREGTGTFVFPSGSVYRGEWRADRRHGNGTMVWQTVPPVAAKGPPPLVLSTTPAASPLPVMIYRGEWQDGVPHGSGEQLWLGAGERLDAGWLRGVGELELVLPPLLCNRYVGRMQHGKRSGEGTFYYASGAHFTGLWADDLKAGPGRFVSENGTTQLLTFSGDRLLGNGTQGLSPESDSGPSISVGDLLEGEPNAEAAARAVAHVLLRTTSELRTLYARYARAGPAVAADAAVLTAAQLGALLKDARLLSPELPLPRVHRLLATHFNCLRPSSPILFREFVEALVRCAYLQPGDPSPLPAKLQRVIMTQLLPLAATRAPPPAANGAAAVLAAPSGVQFVAAREELLREVLGLAEAGSSADGSTAAVSAGQVLALVQACWGDEPNALPARETALGVLEALGVLDDSVGDDPYAPFLLDTQITLGDVWPLLFCQVDKLEGGSASVSTLADLVDAGLRRAAAAMKGGGPVQPEEDHGAFSEDGQASQENVSTR